MKHAYHAETVKTFDTKKSIDMSFVEGDLGTLITVKSGNLKPIQCSVGIKALRQLAIDAEALACQMEADKARTKKVEFTKPVSRVTN